MSIRYRSLAVGMLAAIAAQPCVAAQAEPAAAVRPADAATKSLIEQGRYWQARDNAARAAEAWGRVLMADPRQPEALYNLGLLELKANRPARAREYLAQLRAVDGAGRETAMLEQEVELRSGNRPKELEQARLLASSGEIDKAIPHYRAALDGRTPQGRLALEYYSYLGYADGGWQEARQGLERLQREAPDDVQVSLALAKLLTRNQATRAEGVRRLARLSTRPDVGGDATESWRLALTWYGAPGPAELPLFRDYLKAHPDDAEIRQQMNRTRAGGAGRGTGGQSPQDRQLARAFKALDEGDLAAAESDLASLLQANPNHADALGGMGVLRLRQDRPDDAVEFLTRAARQPRARAGWKRVLTTAQYWSLNAGAERAREAGEFARATQLLEQAMKISQGDASAEIALGRIQADQGEFARAEAIYRAVLARDKDNLGALQGLANVLAQTGRVDEALRMLEPLGPADQEKVGMLGQLRARQARDAARKAAARGDSAGAQRLLEEGLRAYPDDAWLRLDLARLYLKNGAPAEARGVVDGLLLTRPDDAAALQASALLAVETKDWDAALKALDRIPPAQRTRDIVDLQKQAWIRRQAAQAVELANGGRQGEARSMLGRLEAETAQDPTLQASLAAAYVDAGLYPQALTLLRQSMGRSAKPDNDLLLQYTVVLLKTDQDAEAAAVLRQLLTQTLTDAQSRSFEDLRKLYTVRQADALRQRGKLADAYDVLASLLAQYPHDPLVVGALARMYTAAGDRAKALALNREMLQRDPNNADLMTSVALAYAQAGEKDEAEALLAKAVALQPRNPSVLAAAGRVYNGMGKSGTAARYMKAAIAARDAGAPAVAPADTSAPAPVNPFADLPGQTRSHPPAIAALTPAAPAQALPVAPPGADASGPFSTPATYAAAVRDTRRDTPATARAGTATASPAAPSVKTQTASTSADTARAASSMRSEIDAEAPAPAPATAGVPPFLARAAAPAPIPDAVVGSAPPSPFRRVEAGRSTYQPEPASPAPRTLEEELDAIQQARSATVTVGTTVRQHNGMAGMGRMLDIETPVTVRFPVGDDKAFVQATPVTLDAGTVGGGFDSSSRFGGGPAAALAQQQGLVGGPGSQKASGVGLAVGYETGGLKLDLGVTPIGFRYQNLVGGARYDGRIEGGLDSPSLSYGGEISRRAVTDTVMSFAGVRDDRTGESWGGVTSTGGRLSLGLHYDGYGFYGSLGWHSLNGHNVQSNSRLSGGVGTYVQLIRETNRTLTTGLNLTAFGYDKNLAYYTVGNGGYFSPQRFVALSVPLVWAQRQGRFSYQVKGAIGVQHIKQDPVNYFADATRQAQAQAIASAFGSQAAYGGQSKTGIGYNLALAAEYQLAPKWFLGGNFSIDNARDYRQFLGGVYLRYAFEPQTGPMPMPVPAFSSPYASE